MIADKVVAVIGPAFSGESAAADPVLEQAGIPNVSASATNTKLATNGWKFFHRVIGDDAAQGTGDADYLVKTLHASNVAVIDDSSTYGEGLADTVRSQVKTDGGKDVLDDHVDPKGTDYGATVNKIVAAKPDAVFFGGYYDAAGRLINQLKSGGYTGTFMSGDGSEDQRFVTDAGGAPANGSYLTCPCADVTSSTNSQAEAFTSAYRAQFGVAPAIYSPEAFDATNTVLAAIKSGATTASAINAWLASNSYQGLTKTVKFQPDGNVNGTTIYIYQVKNLKIAQIGTAS
jgi:branched-chain amino acid transport system substrate-binding protein